MVLGVIKGDQASIIGGAIEFIKELQQLVQSLEAKKKRKSLSPSPSPSPRPQQLRHGHQLTPSPRTASSSSPSDGGGGGGSLGVVKELGACCNSAVADVEAKLSGPNVLLRTLSRRIPGQVVRIISVLESQAFEILHLNISSMEDTVLYSFIVKVMPSYVLQRGLNSILFHRLDYFIYLPIDLNIFHVISYANIYNIIYSDCRLDSNAN